MTIAYVGLGANLGAREETLRRAVELLGEADGVRRARRLAATRDGARRRRRPAAVPERRRCDRDRTAPRELLDLLLEIERSLGRVREERWGPRTIDLDLLVYGDEVVDEPGLRVPHPHLHERRFALEPLAELEPELDVPGRGRVSDVLAELD